MCREEGLRRRECAFLEQECTSRGSDENSVRPGDSSEALVAHGEKSASPPHHNKSNSIAFSSHGLDTKHWFRVCISGSWVLSMLQVELVFTWWLQRSQSTEKLRDLSVATLCVRLSPSLNRSGSGQGPWCWDCQGLLRALREPV